MEYSTLIAYRIQTICKQRGLSINRLAQMSNIRQSTLDNIMRGVSKNPGIKTLHKVANALSMTVAELLDFEALNLYSFDETK